MTAPWRPGTVVHLGRPASPQFGGDRALDVRIISVSDRPTYPGWAWITGYILGPGGAARDRRELYVLIDGVRVISRPTARQMASRAAVGRPADGRPEDRQRQTRPSGPAAGRRPARSARP